MGISCFLFDVRGDMKKAVLIRVAVSLLAGGGLFAAVGALRGGGLFSSYLTLADAATLPAVLLMGVGGLILASRSGAFDIFSYALTRLVGIFAPFGGRGTARYYEYRAGRERAGFITGAIPLFVGAAFLVLAFLFLSLFYLA